jgi:fumarate reductase (CoM/CoB) subunit A
MMRGLCWEVLRRGIKVINDCLVLKLLVEEGRVVGCVAYDMRKGSFLVFKAKAIILACGGSGQIFKYCIAPYGKTGDGNRMALEVGAELVDMEVFQFHPTSYIVPEDIAGQMITEAVRGEGGRLFNIHGERFMERYNPEQLELACRDFTSRCIYFEVQEGRGTKDGGVYLSVTHLPASVIEERLNTVLRRGLNYGLDIRKEPIIAYPSSHYQDGGIRVDANWESTKVKNLYACGESAGGVHGGNRLGSNSLPDLLVSGKIAGEAAARAALSGKYRKINMANFGEEVARAEKEILEAVETDNAINPIAIRNEIKELSWNYVGIARSEGKLKHALDTLNDIKQNRLPRIGNRTGAYNTSFIEAMDIRSMIVSVEAMVRAALMRTESRCGHFREDYPSPDKVWTLNIVIHQDKAGQYVLTKTPIVETLLDPDDVSLPVFPASGKIKR